MDELNVGRGAQPSSGLLRYGIEAPYVPLGMGAGALLSFVLAGLGLGGTWFVIGLILLAMAALYLYATLVGKHKVWAAALDGLQLRGDESLLDLGCGRGAVLIAAAERLPRGRAVGIDLWHTKDQTGNDMGTAQSNARAMGVADRVELRTADMTALPFADASFDVVTSALAIHNIPSAQGRATAVDEAVRVLRPGGRLVVADIRHVSDYRARLAEQGIVADVRSAGPRYWYGGPWVAASMLTAAKPLA